MERVAVVEVCDRQGTVIDRLKVTSFPLTLGRAWDNDLIIDDPYVCPHHCTITRNEAGELVAHDLGSINGIYAGAEPKRVSQIKLDGKPLRLGHTSVRLRLPGEPLEPARLDAASFHRAGEWPPRSLPINISIVLLAALVMMITGYLNSYTSFDSGRYFFSEQLPVVIAVAGWAAVWSMVSRITLHRFAFFSHVTILVSVILALYLADSILDFLKFGYALEWPFEIVSRLISVAGLTLLFYWSLRLSSEQGRRRLLAISVVIALSISGLVALDEYFDAKEFSASPTFSTLLKPPAVQMVKSKSVEGFFASAEQLRDEVETELGGEGNNAPFQSAGLPSE
ncbi:MAG TPA: FHA domain-containing protein [Gammaproteobacteria bacterium]